MKTIAVLDSNNRLIGSKAVADDVDGIDPGDLRLDGSYKWDAASKAFHPLGHNFGKIKARQPHSTDLVMAKLIEAMGAAAPFEAKEWLDWYNVELRRRDEERSARPR
jgi:hypothetical protein